VQQTKLALSAFGRT